MQREWSNAGINKSLFFQLRIASFSVENRKRAGQAWRDCPYIFSFEHFFWLPFYRQRDAREVYGVSERCRRALSVAVALDKHLHRSAGLRTGSLNCSAKLFHKTAERSCELETIRGMKLGKQVCQIRVSFAESGQEIQTEHRVRVPLKTLKHLRRDLLALEFHSNEGFHPCI